MDMSRGRESTNVEYDCLGIKTKDSDLGIECQKLVSKIEDHGIDNLEEELGVSFNEEERNHLKGAFTGVKNLASEGESSVTRQLFGDLFISDHSAMQTKLKRLKKQTDIEAEEYSKIFREQKMLPSLSLTGKDK